MKKILFLALLALSCQTQPESIYPGHPDPRLKPSLQFAVDGQACDGTCTQQRRSLAKITADLPDKAYLLLINTCARQDEFWNPPKKFSYSYTYAFDVESKDSCPMLLTVVTTDGAFHRGIIDWSNVNHEPAKAEVACNGRWGNHEGFAFCSVAAGLPIRIQTQEPAVIARDPNSQCPEPKGAVKQWDIETQKPEEGKPGICVYVLITKSRKLFRLTTNSYSSILNIFPPKR